MNCKIEYAYTSHKGLRRENNEDNFWCDGTFLPIQNEGTQGVLEGTADWEEAPLFAVFDGMGGESCGEIASGLAAKKLDERQREGRMTFLGRPESCIQELCAELNQTVLEYQAQNHIYSMGSTAVLLLVHRTRVYGVNLGDSRLYRLSSAGLRQISEDQVLGGGRGKAPLLQYLGLEEEDARLLPHIASFRPREGEQLLLCTDGLTDLVMESELEAILRKAPTAREAVQELLALALERGGRDNITMILLRMPRVPYGRLWLRSITEGWRKKA